MPIVRLAVEFEVDEDGLDLLDILAELENTVEWVYPNAHDVYVDTVETFYGGE